MEPVGCLETSESNYQYTLRIIQKEQISKYRFLANALPVLGYQN
jgi:hypothetical protein